MKIHQVLPSYAKHDAIGVHVATTQKWLAEEQRAGYIIAELANATTSGKAKYYKNVNIPPRDLIIYHYSVGCALPGWLASLPNPVVTFYHNITPPQFFMIDGMENSYVHCVIGRWQAPIVCSFTKELWTCSRYSEADLRPLGFPEARYMPVVRDYEVLWKKSQRFSSAGVLFIKPKRPIWLFVGRVVPNKAQHDLMKYLRMYYEVAGDAPKPQLVCAGGIDWNYFNEVIKPLARELGLSLGVGKRGYKKSRDVWFTDTVKESHLIQLYQSAALFFCMSDHEGFCAPLVEAMSFGLPILAHTSSAIPETIGDGGWVVDKTRPEDTLAALKLVMTDADIRKKWQTRSQAEFQKRFTVEVLRRQFNQSIERLVEQFG